MNGPVPWRLPCRWLVGLALCGLVGGLACARPETEPAASARPIIGGTRDTGDPAVVLLVIRKTGTEYDCSGFVVSPHVFVTAAHCLSPSVIGTGFTFDLFLGDNVRDVAQRSDPTNWVATQSTTPHPSFDNGGSPPKYDVGVVVAAAPLGATPLPLGRGAVQPGWVGRTVRAIGYGMTIPGQVSSFGARFEASSVLAGFDGDFVWIDDPTKCGCEGDSGGPMLLDVSGTETVIGVDIWVQDPTNCTGQLVAARTDIHAGFIDPFIEANDPGFLTPQQDAAVPQDASPPADVMSPDAGALADGGGGTPDGDGDGAPDAADGNVGGGCVASPERARSRAAALTALGLALAAGGRARCRSGRRRREQDGARPLV
ncbi:MAG: trypsin-like serine protease [Deltaproteobacteria bacterium]|nr:trypsin-like serine protease [Deltaproteobacteria bacterium]